ncbi:hypothetical protein GM921_06175 [Pedobacter sp. LMG 31464]|uniref:Uncharacterized protein n=1 Tax=Pedobacter planticolens TaxID=2679964 RepID=A0A923DXT9_9SPHI|nr:hypothetical protein [Pedobacter planticolens]MBB2145060.1 hypothetical protein [Pedobacter planticolens]
MIYANKKVVSKSNLAQQTAQIISNIKEWESKNLIRLEADTVFLYPQLWKDKISALNWINCLHHYYCIKKQMKASGSLYFKNIETDELIGSMLNKKPKVLLF